MPSPLETRQTLQARKVRVAFGAAATFGLCLADAVLLCFGKIFGHNLQPHSSNDATIFLLMALVAWVGACAVYLSYQLRTPRGRMGCLLYLPLMFSPTAMAMILPGSLLSLAHTAVLAGLIYLNYRALRTLDDLDTAIDQAPMDPSSARPLKPPVPSPDPMDQVELPPGWDERKPKDSR